MLIFDNETNGLLKTMDRLHCVTFWDTDEERYFRGSPDGRGTVDRGDVRITIDEAVQRIEDADMIVGHNIIGFDIPAMQIVYPRFKPRGVIRDTILMSRLIYTDLADRDYRNRKKFPHFPGNLIGSHALEAWGIRLKEWKGDYSKAMKERGLDPWAEWNQEMDDYCKQDVAVTRKLWDKLIAQGFGEESIELEHQLAPIMARQERYGFLFDVKSAQVLEEKLMTRRVALEQQLQQAFPPWEAVDKVLIPKRDNKTRGYKAGVPVTKMKTVVFNPASRHHIADRLKAKYGWKPEAFTENGTPQVDESILKALPYEEATLLNEFLLVDKRLGQLCTGNQNWVKLTEADGRIHGRVTQNGAVTGRMTHSNPNIAQVPKCGSPYGTECRSLFYVPPGKLLVGADASGLELRCLAHYMGKWDAGDYAKIILEGDIHTVNQQAAGLPTRDNAKTFIYAFLYGAGDAKIGSIVGKGAKAGKELKKKFLAGLPALDRLLHAIEVTVERNGYLRGLDGRLLHIRSSHAALNTLLQSAGAVVMKKALVILDQRLQARGYIPGVHYEFVANVHDEWQIECDANIAEEVGQAAASAITSAGEAFGFRCPLAGEYKSGRNWAETH